MTTTTELHEATLFNPSTAVQLNGVVPTGNSDPDGGVHVVVTGGVPPDVTVTNVTATGFPVDDEALGALQVMDNVGVVPAGVCPTASFEFGLIARALLYAWTTK